VNPSRKVRRNSQITFDERAIDNVGYARAKMRIDPKGTVAGWPALLVRRTLRQLRTRVQWGLPELKSTASVKAEEGRALIKGLLAEGLIEAAGRDAWKVTQAGQTLSSATAARRVTRATASQHANRSDPGYTPFHRDVLRRPDAT
jgi:hypothetical protein